MLATRTHRVQVLWKIDFPHGAGGFGHRHRDAAVSVWKPQQQQSWKTGCALNESFSKQKFSILNYRKTPFANAFLSVEYLCFLLLSPPLSVFMRHQPVAALGHLILLMLCLKKSTLMRRMAHFCDKFVTDSRGGRTQGLTE